VTTSNRPAGFRFIDLPTAAEALGVTRTQLLEWVTEGRIKPFQGTGQAAVFRTRDVEALATTLGQERQAAADAAAAEAAAPPSPPVVVPRKREGALRRDPVKKVGTRLSQDMRWAEISDEDLAGWFDALDRRSYGAVRHAARQAITRLNQILDLTGGRGTTLADQAVQDSGKVPTVRDILATAGGGGRADEE
jgi:hypothetical protein